MERILTEKQDQKCFRSERTFDHCRPDALSSSLPLDEPEFPSGRAATGSSPGPSPLSLLPEAGLRSSRRNAAWRMTTGTPAASSKGGRRSKWRWEREVFEDEGDEERGRGSGRGGAGVERVGEQGKVFRRRRAADELGQGAAAGAGGSLVQGAAAGAGTSLVKGAADRVGAVGSHPYN